MNMFWKFNLAVLFCEVLFFVFLSICLQQFGFRSFNLMCYIGDLLSAVRQMRDGCERPAGSQGANSVKRTGQPRGDPRVSW